MQLNHRHFVKNPRVTAVKTQLLFQQTAEQLLPQWRALHFTNEHNRCTCGAMQRCITCLHK